MNMSECVFYQRGSRSETYEPIWSESRESLSLRGDDHLTFSIESVFLNWNWLAIRRFFIALAKEHDLDLTILMKRKEGSIKREMFFRLVGSVENVRSVRRKASMGKDFDLPSCISVYW
jgi:hypothetical protein